MSSLFEAHPWREALSNELHARPPVALETPAFVTYLAFLHHRHSADEESRHLAELADQLGLPAPDTSSGHVLLNARRFRLKWERHTEFSSYSFFCHIDNGADADQYALLHVPAAWRKAIPGQLIAATHIELRSVAELPLERVLQQQSRFGKNMVAAAISDGAGWLLTDFHLHDGFSHFLLLDNGLTPRQAGRIAQRVVEIETYRVMALLAFPVAKEVGQLVSGAEGELADLMDAMNASHSTADDRAVLQHLTRLAASVERSVARTTYRFGAAAAYYRLVRQRIDDLREQRLPGFSPIGEFMDRRLAPAIDTCASIARRQAELSDRISRSSQLLRTRVDIEIERQNQELLTQMNRRTRIQLRLQETVEGLSVVAITYYASQLVNYFSQGIAPLIAPLTPSMVTTAAIPLIAATVFFSLRRLRKHLSTEADQDS